MHKQKRPQFRFDTWCWQLIWACKEANFDLMLCNFYGSDTIFLFQQQWIMFIDFPYTSETLALGKQRSLVAREFFLHETLLNAYQTVLIHGSRPSPWAGKCYEESWTTLLSSRALNQAHEQTNVIKSHWEIIGFTGIPSALKKWTVTGAQVSCLVQDYEKLDVWNEAPK